MNNSPAGSSVRLNPNASQRPADVTKQSSADFRGKYATISLHLLGFKRVMTSLFVYALNECKHEITIFIKQYFVHR